MVDVLTVGLGPAAYTCALYTARYKLSTKMIGQQNGGQVFVSGDVENYTGFDIIDGRELTTKMQQQVEAIDVEIVHDEVTKIEKKSDHFVVTGSVSGEHQAKTVLLSMGLKSRTLGVPGEQEMYGKGVTYCATCDGMFFRGKNVGIVGGGNSAAEAALYLSEICPQVHVFVRKDQFRADQIVVDKLMAKENIIVEFNTEIAEFTIADRLEQVVLKNGETRDLSGVFVEIGADPRKQLATDLGCAVDDESYVAVDAGMRTNIAGVFCAGDLSTGSEKFAQIATAVGEGAVAANSIHTYIQHL